MISILLPLASALGNKTISHLYQDLTMHTLKAFGEGDIMVINQYTSIISPRWLLWSARTLSMWYSNSLSYHLKNRLPHQIFCNSCLWWLSTFLYVGYIVLHSSMVKCHQILQLQISNLKCGTCTSVNNLASKANTTE